MDRKFSYIGLAAAAALIGQQALAQSATVDASANVVAQESTIEVTGSAGSLGTVKIPAENEECNYVVGGTVDNDAAHHDHFYDQEASIIPYASRVAVNAQPSGSSCEISGNTVPAIFSISCEPNTELNVLLSASVDAGASYNGLSFSARNVREADFDLGESNLLAGSCSSDGKLFYVPQLLLSMGSDAQPYNGVVGSVTADVSY